MLTIRSFLTTDILLGMRLKDEAHWNQLEADWRRALRLEPTGCFVGLWDDRPVASLTTCVFDEAAWIAMVLTDAEYRGRGIASGLMRHALDYLRGRGVHTVRLDATAFGRPVYEKLGFTVDFELTRFCGTGKCEHAPSAVALTVAVEPLKPTNSDAAWKLDRQVTKTNRGRFLDCLRDEQPADAAWVQLGGDCRGFALARAGSRALQIGPVIAVDELAGAALLGGSLRRVGERLVYIDVPTANHSAVSLCEAAGLSGERNFLRMSLGKPLKEDVQAMWASSGPEKG